MSGVTYADRINPAKKYCETLGYEYKYDPNTGSEVCILPSKDTVIAWEFLLGGVAQEYSYCKKTGLDIRTINNSEICSDLGLESCAVCIYPDGKEIEVTKAMDLKVTTESCSDGFCNIGETYKTCKTDCPSGSEDGYCDMVNDGICDNDCIVQQIPASDIDCPYCGDGICKNEENYKNCQADCPSGFKDNYCDGISDGRCDSDCTEGKDIDCSCGNHICEKLENSVICPKDCKKTFWQTIMDLIKSIFK